MNEIKIIRAGDTYAVQFPQREFVLTRRDDAVTIAQYYADQHGLPIVEDGKTIYTPTTRDGFAVLSHREIERNLAQAADDGDRIIPPGFLDDARAAIAKATAK